MYRRYSQVGPCCWNLSLYLLKSGYTKKMFCEVRYKVLAKRGFGQKLLTAQLDDDLAETKLMGAETLNFEKKKFPEWLNIDLVEEFES